MAQSNPNRLKLSQLRALVAIAKTGTFSDAALQLDLSQSAVSHAIATLETELGVILLNRGRQGAVLTPVGATITAEAEAVLNRLDTICQQAQLAKGLQSGQVRIGGFRSVATHILPAVIERFRQQYPGISVTIDEFSHYRRVDESLREGRIDIGFSYLPAGKEFDAWELLRDEYIVLLPPAAKPVNAQLTWEQLFSYPLIQTPPGDGCRYKIEQYLMRHQQPCKFAYDVREDSTIVSMVQKGLGATIMAKLAAEPIPDDIIVAQLPDPFERVIGVITLTDALQPPSVFAFLDTIKAVWGGKPGESQAA
ncbi:LysR family transcriptional regulator [Leptothoe kymatousa]|uniref:LysR family transcriptional regulator n=1 Tax=Leptothoe kymatousa TAU-MAC 1615 TaxID=2364775 RepID=A0ABS5Y1V3_9CYAN|nr:LysR family transcriptional regulator [Leptothoe kymatousa]MBT9311810.1 LysR family transcriptional regulator [Leptothoe kymatousa TAU-MAC 1615]